MEIAEKIAESAVAPSRGECWFCTEERVGEEKKTILKANPDTSGASENDLDNDSGTLGSNLGEAGDDQPQWSITRPDNETSGSFVVPAAHHCIPGEASLANAENLHQLMIEGGDFNLESDIGYDVNCAENGVWLPGNYAVQPGQYGWRRKWGRYGPEFKNEYSKRAIDEANRQFHDAHPSYNKKVLRTLESIAARVGEPKGKCPICQQQCDKRRPPYGLVGRLNHVSEKHREMLINLTDESKKYVLNGYYTSSRVKTYFGILPKK